MIHSFVWPKEHAREINVRYSLHFIVADRRVISPARLDDIYRRLPILSNICSDSRRFTLLYTRELSRKMVNFIFSSPLYRPLRPKCRARLIVAITKTLKIPLETGSLLTDNIFFELSFLSRMINKQYSQ